MQTKYFILDCQSNPVGNPAGYRTMRGAIQQATAKNSKIKHSLWQAFHAWRDKNPSHSLVYKIKACEVQ